MKIYGSISELVGKTPLVRLSRMEKTLGLSCALCAKLEYYNPAGSAKDRVAVSMIERAEAEGKLCKGSVIIEPTSGNTGIGLAAVAASRGYRVILTMPSTMSVERQKLLRAYGAELILTDGVLGMKGAIDEAERLAATMDGAFLAGQFENPANPDAHYRTTGPEIYEDTDGAVDIFVAGVGTGGTISGVGRYLKEKKPGVKIVAVEPDSSPVLSGGKAGAHGLQGIGAGFVPKNMDREICDEVIRVTEEQAYEYGRTLAVQEGYLVGISSGACLYAACELARRPENRGKTVVALLPDTGARYLSTPLFKEEN